MKKTKFVTLSIIISVFLSCIGHKSKQIEVESNDSLKKSLLADTLIFESDSIEVIPENVDDLFADFVYCFFSNENLQEKRTEFPLLFVENGVERSIPRTDWSFISLLGNLECYAIIHERETDLEQFSEQMICKISVKLVLQNNSEVISYNFHKVSEKWILTDVCRTPLQSEKDGDFIQFFYRFTSDSLFQENHLCSSLQMAILDPVDEFNTIEATINSEQWSSFAPILTNNSLLFLDLGLNHIGYSSCKFISLRGFGNGLDNTFKFIRKDNTWMLSKFEDYSN